MALRIRHNLESTWDDLGFTIIMKRQLKENEIQELMQLLECWHKFGNYYGFGTGRFGYMTKPQYEDDELMISWHLQMGKTGEKSIRALARMLGAFNKEFKRPLKELYYGHLVIE